MTSFVKIYTDMYPATGIERVDLNANIGGLIGVEVKLKGIPETFTYTQDCVAVATDALLAFVGSAFLRIGDTLIPSDVLPIGNDNIVVADIEWVNLNANFNGEPGVEIRLATDGNTPQGIPLTRQYTRDLASLAFDLLTQLAPQQATAEATA